MQTKAKSNSIITHSLLPGNILAFHVLGAGDIQLHLDMVSEANKERAAVHGFIQRGSDRAAKGRDPETGRSATAEEKFQAIRAWADFMETGTDSWSMVAEGSGEPKGGLVLRAIAQVLGIGVAEAGEKVKRQAEKKGKSVQKVLAEYRVNPGKVKDEYDRLKELEDKANASGIDVDADLDALMEG